MFNIAVHKQETVVNDSWVGWPQREQHTHLKSLEMSELQIRSSHFLLAISSWKQHEHVRVVTRWRKRNVSLQSVTATGWCLISATNVNALFRVQTAASRSWVLIHTHSSSLWSGSVRGNAVNVDCMYYFDR